MSPGLSDLAFDDLTAVDSALEYAITQARGQILAIMREDPKPTDDTLVDTLSDWIIHWRLVRERLRQARTAHRREPAE